MVYIVLRAAPDMPPGFLREDMDGRWYDLATMKRGTSETGVSARPTDRYEEREDGVRAQIWEVRGEN